MKRIAYSFVAISSAFFLAAPAMAFGGFTLPSNDITVNNLGTKIVNTLFTSSESNNDIRGKYVTGGKIRVGDVVSVADVSNTVNTTAVNGCGDCVNGDVTVNNKFTGLTNFAVTKAKSNNDLGGKVVGGWTSPSITVKQVAAQATIVNDVNTTIVGDFVSAE